MPRLFLSPTTPSSQTAALALTILLALTAALSLASLAVGASGGFTIYRGRRITVSNPFLASLLGGSAGGDVTLGGDAPATRVGYARVTRDAASDGSAAASAAATRALGSTPAGVGGWEAFVLAASTVAAAALAVVTLTSPTAGGRPAVIAGCVTAPILLASTIAFHAVNVKALAGGLRPVDAAGLATVSATQSPGPAFGLAVAAAGVWWVAAIVGGGLPRGVAAKAGDGEVAVGV